MPLKLFLTNRKKFCILHTWAKTYVKTCVIMNKKKTTIKDIAKILNIHHTTVSRALRDHPDVNPETKKSILETAEKLHYKPNIFARNLKQNTTNIIGVIVPEIEHHFFSSVISGIEKVAYDQNYVILVCQSNESYEREILNTQALMSNRVAGMLVSISQTTRDTAHFKEFINEGGNLVFFDRVAEDIAANKVVIDDYEGAFLATEHLIKRGKKKIVHLAGTKGINISKERLRGYCDALKNKGIEFDPDLVYYGGFREKDGAEGMRHLLNLSKKIDAVFAVNDPSALGAYGVIKEHGLRIPDDIAVVGFSNNPITAVVSPPLTTIEQRAYEMGEKAAEMLFNQINDDTMPGNYRTETLKPKLIIRSST